MGRNRVWMLSLAGLVILGSLRSASCLFLVAGAGLTLDLLVRVNVSVAFVSAFALTAPSTSGSALFHAGMLAYVMFIVVLGLDGRARESDARGPLTSGPEGAL